MLIATDLDGCLALCNKEEIAELNSLFEKHNCTVVYVTGRDIKKFRELTKTFYKEKGIKLFPPDYLITLNGVRVYQFRKSRLLPLKKFWIDKHWYKLIKPGWNKKQCFEAYVETAKKVRFFADYPAVVDIKYKPTPYHIECTLFHGKLDLVKDTLKEECKKRNTKVNIIFDYLESHHVNLGLKILDAIDYKKSNIIRKMLDERGGLYVMMPCATTKGEAVDYLRKKLGFEKDQVIAAGDGGNDYHLLTKGFKSIIVNNAHPVLLREPIEKLPEEEKANIIFVKSDGAQGLLEGIKIVLDKSLSHGGDGSLRSVINA